MAVIISLGANETGMVSVNGQPYQKGTLQPHQYEDGGVKYTKLAIRRDDVETILPATHFGAIINETTGDPFASASELQTFVEENFFFRVTGTGGGGTGGSGLDASGTSFFSGDGSKLFFDIPHGLGHVPTTALITATSADAVGFTYVEKGPLKIRIHFDVAPGVGLDNVKIDWIAQGNAGDGTDPDAVDAFARYASITNPQKTPINNFITTLRDASIWPKFEDFGIILNGVLMNLKQANDPVLVGSPVFTTPGEVGWGASNANYAKLGTIPSAALQLNDCSVGYYAMSYVSGVNYMIGTDEFLGTTMLRIANVDHQIYGEVNDNVGGSSAPSGYNGAGWLIVSRVDSTENRVYSGDTLIGTKTATSASLPPHEMYLGCSEYNNGPSGHSDIACGGWFVGAGLLGSEVTVLKNAFSTLRTALGF